MRLNKLYDNNGTPHDRYVVVGTSGSGKSTLADKLAWQIGCRHVELDALFWLPDWQMRPTEEFRQLVTEATAADRWVVDGNYSIARDAAWRRAEAIVWLDLPFHVVMAQVIKRTLSRCLTGRELWNTTNRASDVHVGQVGEAEARLLSQPKIVDFAVQWMEKYRT